MDTDQAEAEQSTGPFATAPDDASSAAGDKAAKPDVPPARAALVKRMQNEIKAALTHWKSDFDRMEKNIKLVGDRKNALANGDANKYVVNLLQRQIQERTSTLYAKNPRCRAKRKQRMEFRIWDGTEEMLQQAMSTFQQSLAIQDPNQRAQVLAPVQDLIDDIKQGKAARDMLARVGKTLEILFHFYLDESEPRFKIQAKQLVRRTLTTGVGWTKLSYQRKLGKSPDVIDQINDITQQLAYLDRLQAESKEGDIAPDDADAEAFKQALAALQSRADVLIEEGLVFTFPKTQRVILDPATTQISGFIGTRWLAEEILLTPDRIQEIYGVEVGRNYTAYQPDGQLSTGVTPSVTESDGPSKALARIFERYNRADGLVYTICEGYPDFLEEPRKPSVRLKRFFPYFSLIFNEVENNDDTCYPQSDVDIILHPQQEYNRMREALRQHRIASAPFYVSSAATLEEEDVSKLSTRAPHDVLQLKGLPPGTDPDKVIAPMKTVPIDPNLYEVNTAFTDIQRSSGSQQADFGGTPNKGTATAASIAEGAKTSSTDSNTDDLDEMLTDIARCASEVMLSEFDLKTVQGIVGPGAVWPQFSNEDISDQVFLEIIAGSSGKPNKAQDLANFERVSPFILQTPGVNPAWIARTAVSFVDDSVDLEDALLDGIPSMVAQNAMASHPPAPPGAPPGVPAAGAGPAKPPGPPPGGPSSSPMPPPGPGPLPGLPLRPVPPQGPPLPPVQMGPQPGFPPPQQPR